MEYAHVKAEFIKGLAGKQLIVNGQDPTIMGLLRELNFEGEIITFEVDEEVRKKRGEIIMEQQYNIFEKLNHDNIGKTMRCVVEGYDGYTDSYYGRTWRDAPDIDGSVSFTCGYELNEGDFVDVEIFDVNEYDLIGEVI